MPFYDLTCTACGAEYNKKASLADRESGNIACPECGARHPATRYLKRNSLSASAGSGSAGNPGAAAGCPNAHVCGGCCHH